MFAVCDWSNLLAAGIMIGKPLNPMTTNHDIESILSTSDTFYTTPEIPFTTPVEDITQAVIDYRESGIPSCSDVLVNAHSTGDAHNATGPILSCPLEWVTWLQESFIVPSCLVPYGGNNLLPDGTQSILLRLFGPEHDALFQDDLCSTFTHNLLCVGGTDVGKHWFMTAAEDWPEVTEHLSPFNIYFYTQRKGDLVILPPRRICAKIRYHPHQILCSIVLKLYEELVNLKRSQPNNLSLLLAKSGILKWGFSLLDEVINSSYCSQDKLLPVVEPTLPPPPCSFCGGELFQTVFCCTDSCVRDGVTSSSVDCKILICNYCFIDGRACRCGSMAPYRIQPLDGLIELRMNIANLLGASDENDSAWSDLDPQRCGMFNVAKALCEIRAKSTQSVERSCSIQPAPSHHVSKFSVINCLHCHANRCYKHILSTYHVHSTQALKADLADATSTLWHNLHKEMKDTYATKYPQLRVAIRNGSCYPLGHRLAYYASNYAPTTPLNQAVSLGFYDTPDNTVAQGVSLRHSRSRSTSVASLAGVETGVPRQLHQRGSGVQSSSTVVEGSNSQKQRLSPPEEGAVASKRA
ncbi:hypothetical protein BDM02DRAFT_3129802 [Thelephora ganbajun]|uniref:Uncharacterized protein n=1 Tax=Thelephora ganbajun TaxID=370292 RepID=A0ACB6ZCT9_THEGA|nr:hypothetical protein BDM02DRAFT_3129802 [Thelephora ganbajun]